jgi:hypothetical protein
MDEEKTIVDEQYRDVYRRTPREMDALVDHFTHTSAHKFGNPIRENGIRVWHVGGRNMHPSPLEYASGHEVNVALDVLR